jgi:hypothetical protein
MRYAAPHPVELNASAEFMPWQSPPAGPLAAPGTYQVSLSQRVLGEWKQLSEPQAFSLKPMFTGGLVAADQQARLAFELEAAELFRAVSGADRAAGELTNQLDHLFAALKETPGADEEIAQKARALKTGLQELQVLLNGDSSLSNRYEPVPLSLTGRIGYIIGGYWDSQAAVPQGYRDSLEIANADYAVAVEQLQLIAADVAALGAEAEALGAPWTPGRLPAPQQ